MAGVEPRYRSILLKLSGEALAGTRGHGIDPDIAEHIISEVKQVYDAGVKVGIVIGGGNIYRGASGPIARTTGDMMGMLATVINALALKEFFCSADIPAVAFSALRIDKAAEFFSADKARAVLNGGSIIIMAGGTGNPFFTTDTAAALRAAEIDAEVIIKATQVDGVYDSDPVKNPDAVRYETVSYDEALQKNLKVMDSTALSFCRDNSIPIVVFKLSDKGKLFKFVMGETIGSLITKGVEK
ncbi:MAG: UMP kinase [Chitinivibrionales bacterium]|nr:UMP kinase [Chitinivibrionales bacterium]